VQQPETYDQYADDDGYTSDATFLTFDPFDLAQGKV
jgi:hypothetical protein